VTVEDTTGVVHMSRGVLEPASEYLLSEPAIIAGMAKATLGDRTTVDWDALTDNYDRIREHIEHVVPGFTQYNTRVRQPGGFYLPNAPYQGKFNTPSRRAGFTVQAIPHHDLAPDQLLLMTIRSHDQFNTTIYGLHDRYRGLHFERRVVMMNREDMDEQGLSPRQVVDVVSHFAGQTRVAPGFVVVEYPIPRRCAAMYYPESNVLAPIGSTEPLSNIPTYKSIVISVHPAEPPSGYPVGRR